MQELVAAAIDSEVCGRSAVPRIGHSYRPRRRVFRHRLGPDPLSADADAGLVGEAI